MLRCAGAEMLLEMNKEKNKAETKQATTPFSKQAAWGRRDGKHFPGAYHAWLAPLFHGRHALRCLHLLPAAACCRRAAARERTLHLPHHYLPTTCLPSFFSVTISLLYARDSSLPPTTYRFVRISIITLLQYLP